MLNVMQLIIQVEGQMQNLPPVGFNAAALISSELNPASPPT